MSGGYGPPLLNFQPLANLGKTFFDAKDQALERNLKQMQLQSGDEIAKAMASGMGGPPSAAGQPTQPLSALGQPQPKQPTFAAMDGTNPTQQLGGDREAFTRSVMPFALEASKQTGVDPRIIVAQAALESAWGTKAPGNNFFGIKSHGQGGGQNLATTEVINGQPVQVNDSFRTYGGLGDSVKGYSDFINSNPRYASLKTAQGLDSQIQALQASGYATDPNYGAKIASIAKGLPGADLPAPGAQNAQGFLIPGQSAGQGGSPVQVPAYVQNMLGSQNPYVRAKGVELYQQYQKAQQDFAVKLWEKNWEQANKDREFSLKGQEVGISQGRLENDRERLGHDMTKPQAVGNALVGPDGSVVYRGPNVKTEVVNGRIVYIDQNAGKASDITPDGIDGKWEIKTIKNADGSETPVYFNPANKQTEPVPGFATGPSKAALAEAQAKQAADIVVQDIDRIFELAKQSRLPVTGGAGQAMSYLAGTNAHDISNLVTTIKANATFDRLQQMRKASPTGGALGAVSDNENKLLGSAIGSLEQSQSHDQFIRNLTRVKKIYTDIIHGPGAGGEGGSLKSSQGDAQVDQSGWVAAPGGIRIREKR
ncbi:glycoside hydrolase family 73 protein [Microvirga alba]|uniref:Glucosaminidase domain-containing protein n=1 Tax=Microvirga alba TaxID=2791025 RepID=A0A931BS37_9HYPH|nr:glucosaminidase domain-containing protein [Microvirga alba]MBF9234684.1 glucosaminidase domain-containing protein [Microvirga alba]